jgi:hypothetical protein
MKNKATLFLLSKMILLIGVSYLLFSQLSRVKTNDWRNLEIKHPNLLLLSCSLLVFNWGFEWFKWRNTIRIIEPTSTLKTNIRAFMAGIATGLLTPNMLGNFLGRIYYYKSESRNSIVLMTLLANFSQFFASIFFGLVSLLILKETPWGISLTLINYLLLFCCSSMLVFYFFFENLKWKFLLKKPNFIKINQLIKVDSRYRFKVLILSIFRHFIFTLQFWLMFNAFEDAYNFDTFLWIWQIFLWTTLVPSLWFGKLIIRESIALLVLGSVGFGQVEILTSSILIWLVNLAFPALISIFICKQIQTEVE